MWDDFGLGEHARSLISFVTGETHLLRDGRVAMGGMDVRFDQRAQRDIAKAMRGLGWEPGFKSVGHAKTTRGYWKRDADRGEKFGVDKVEELW